MAAGHQDGSFSEALHCSESVGYKCRLLDGQCSDEPSGAMAVAKAMSRLAALRSVLSDVSSQLQVGNESCKNLGGVSLRVDRRQMLQCSPCNPVLWQFFATIHLNLQLSHVS